MKSRDDDIEALADAIGAEHDVLLSRLRDTITALPCVPVIQTAALISLAELAAMVIASLQESVNPTGRWRELFDERLDRRLELYALHADATEG